jgi:8-oxo-dGTP diphosphatase
MRIPMGVWGIVKEVARHILRRPVVGIAAAARTPDGKWLLIRRTDTGQWALPGGTLEWGETLSTAIVRELREEAGVDVLQLGELAGVYSAPQRDIRFHAVTIVVHAEVTFPTRAPLNSLEISEVKLFDEHNLPDTLAHGMGDMLRDARSQHARWE